MPFLTLLVSGICRDKDVLFKGGCGRRRRRCGRRDDLWLRGANFACHARWRRGNFGSHPSPPSVVSCFFPFGALPLGIRTYCLKSGEFVAGDRVFILPSCERLPDGGWQFSVCFIIWTVAAIVYDSCVGQGLTIFQAVGSVKIVV